MTVKGELECSSGREEVHLHDKMEWSLSIAVIPARNHKNQRTETTVYFHE